MTNEPRLRFVPRSFGPDVSGMGEVLSVTDVEAEVAEPPVEEGGRCGARHEIGMGDLLCSIQVDGTGSHPRPHRDKVHGVAWDDSPMALPWPPHTAALVVRDLIDAGQHLLTVLVGNVRPGSPTDIQARPRWDEAVAAAELLPGVREEPSQ